MTYRNTITVFVFCAALGGTAFAQQDPSLAEARRTIETFIQFAMGNAYAEAFEFLRETPNLIPASEFAEIESLTTEQAPTIRQLYGRVIDSRLVSEEVVGEFAAKLVYVMRHERHIIRWNFIYYRPENTWFLTAISFDDRVNDLFSGR